MRTALAAIAATVLMLALAAPAFADSHEGQVTVVHGVPDLTVDVWVNGEATLEGFEPGTITDPLTLPEGDYEIEIFPAGADPAEEEPAIAGSASLPAGANVSIIAHLDADGNPTLSVFANDVSATAADEARLTVRHTAAAPAVDVRAGSEPVFEDLANGDEAGVDLPAGTISADVVPAGESEPVIGPADLDLEAGTATFVYAIGSLEDDNLDLLVQTVTGLGDAPTAVHSGTGGQAASTAFPLWALALMVGAGTLALGSGVRLARSRA